MNASFLKTRIKARHFEPIHGGKMKSDDTTGVCLGRELLRGFKQRVEMITALGEAGNSF